MEWLEILALILAVVGLIGCVLPALPGPPISYAGLICIYINSQQNGGEEPGLSLLLIWGVVTVLITVLDYVVPAMLTKVTGGHKAASTGAIIGMIAGIILTPIGMILGSLLGAFLGELLVEKSDAWTALKASIGTFAGFIVGTLGKVICSGIMLFEILRQIL